MYLGRYYFQLPSISKHGVVRAVESGGTIWRFRVNLKFKFTSADPGLVVGLEITIFQASWSGDNVCQGKEC
jgi:hypothetical protein